MDSPGESHHVVERTDGADPHHNIGICSRREGCVLQAGHRGACKIGAVEEEDYEVEAVMEEQQHGGAPGPWMVGAGM